MTQQHKKVPLRLTYEKKYWRDGYQYIAGVDEAGRGPLAGPVTAAAVILDPEKAHLLARVVRDSKELSPLQREHLFTLVIQSSLAYSYSSVSSLVIDKIGIVPATHRAMKNCIKKLCIRPDLLLIDAVTLRSVDTPQEAIVHGDAIIPSIAAASIIAKVIRDRLMLRMSLKYPSFTFAQHKGYGTRAHMAELSKKKPSPIHRRSFIAHL